MALNRSLQTLMAHSAPVGDARAEAASDRLSRDWAGLVLTIVFAISAVALLTWTLASLIAEIL